MATKPVKTRPVKIVGNQENLGFSKVQPGKYNSKGLLETKAGDIIRFKITGTNQKLVEKFKKHQSDGTTTGKGINITVGSSKDKETLLSEIEAIKNLKVNSEEFTAKENAIVVDQVVTMDISPNLQAKHLSDKPFVLQYAIDPKIKNGEIQDYTFASSGTVEISCTVESGKVKIQLFEFTNPQFTSSIQVFSATNPAVKDLEVSSSSPGKFKIAHNASVGGTGNWNFRVTGLTASNSEYALTIGLIWDVTKDYNTATAIASNIPHVK